jgi:hypothetical protein
MNQALCAHMNNKRKMKKKIMRFIKKHSVPHILGQEREPVDTV